MHDYHRTMHHYELTIHRTDGNFVKEFTVLADAMVAFEDTLAIPDDKRVCLKLHGPDTWVVSYQ